MPFGDRTGPLGQGPMTGRGRGLCAGNATPGSVNPGQGAGMGRGGRGGRGRQNRVRAGAMQARAAAAAPADRQKEIAELKAAIDGLLNTVGEIQKRVEELEAPPKPE